jgi:hypothetical protein
VGWDSSVGKVTFYGLDGRGSNPAYPSGRPVKGEGLLLIACGIVGSNPGGGMDACVACCRGISDIRTDDMKVRYE